MALPKTNNRRNAIAQIHIAKKALGMDDDTYRQMLGTVTRGKAQSCSDCSLGDLYSVIAHLEQRGWKNNRRKYSPRAKGRVIDVMRALWIQMHQAGIVSDPSETALTTWAKRQSSQMNGGVGIASLDWLERDPKLASQVLESLKKWNKRARRERGLA